MGRLEPFAPTDYGGFNTKKEDLTSISAGISCATLFAALTNDPDLVEPMRIITPELGMHVTPLTPTARPAGSLVASNVRHIQLYIGPCQRPDPVTAPGKRPIGKPAGR